MPAISDLEILEIWKKDLENYFQQHRISLTTNDAELGVKKWVLLIEEELQKLWLYKVGTGSYPQTNSNINQSLNFRIQLLALSAERAREAFDALLQVIELYTERNIPLPSSIATWKEKYDSAQCQRPRQHGPSKYSNWGRDIHIAWSIYALELGGLSPTRNDASISICGCDLVTDAYIEVTRNPMNYRLAKSIWKRYSNPKATLSEF
ncbi:MAG: hypothetical protein O2971_13245 [Proteobacteria bacterium]|nr:hypothetical protein [Pseudomonadota bacterium]